ncbi:MAG: GntR family transcriptional regulator [Paenibacillus sp.]|nr:GntR family transcriptional regulator [Paenibacillus sp.]
MKLSRSKRPLYLQLKHILKDRILHGVYPLDSMIPSEPQLEQEFHVSKITVRNAIIELTQEGYLEKGSGKGTKVIRNTPTVKRSTWKSFTEILVEEGHQIQKRLIRAEIAVNPEGSEAHRWFGERCLRLERLYLLNGMPYIHYTHYLTLDKGRFDLMELNADDKSLYGMLEEQDIVLASFRDEFAVAQAPEQAAKLLQTALQTALLQRRRFAYDETGELIEFSEGYYSSGMQPYIVQYQS